MAGANCSKCGELKLGSYADRGTCGPCTEARRSQRRREKREAAGLPEWGAGRDPKCKVCRAVKEAPYVNGSLCRACKLAKAKVDYDKKARDAGVPIRNCGRNPMCGTCGLEKENKDDHYCHACRAKMKRDKYAINRLDPEFMQGVRDKEARKFQESQSARMKKNCREKTNRAIQSGKLPRQPCEVCGTDEKIDAHHDDYTRPFDVRWLCRVHHAEHHRMKD